MCEDELCHHRQAKGEEEVESSETLIYSAQSWKITPELHTGSELCC